MPVELHLDATSAGEHLDLTRYSLSQGGISPMPETWTAR